MGTTQSVTRVFLSLGSNLGDRGAKLSAALRLLDETPGVVLIQWSHCYETAPIGEPDQPIFWNLAAEIETELAPLELLNGTKGIEKRLGRETSYRWGPRNIDIDVILWGDAVVTTERLTVPHKEFRSRAFVLTPLAEIAPDAVDPETGRTVAELAASPQAQGRVEKRGRLTP